MIEQQTVTMKTLVAAIAATWAAGTAVAVWAANQEGRVTALEEKQTETKVERTALKESTDELADTVRDLNLNIMLLQQRLELEREFETVAEEVEEE